MAVKLIEAMARGYNSLVGLERPYFTHITQFDKIIHDDIIKWKHFLHYWAFARGIHRSPVQLSRKQPVFCSDCAENRQQTIDDQDFWQHIDSLYIL